LGHLAHRPGVQSVDGPCAKFGKRGVADASDSRPTSRTARLTSERGETQWSSDDCGRAGEKATTYDRGEERLTCTAGRGAVDTRGIGGSTTSRTGSTPLAAGDATCGIAGLASVLSTKYESVSKKNTLGTDGSQ
jgi:hypothetical protein